MHCKPTPNQAELNVFIEPVIEQVNDTASFPSIIVKDQSLLTAEIINQLALNCTDGSPSVAQASQQIVWQLCQHMGTPYTTCISLLECIKRDQISDMIVPIVDANWIPFELLSIILAAGKEMEVGPLLFCVNPNNPNCRSFISQILCAAMKQNWLAPVLFYHGEKQLPVETVNLDWKKMLYFNSYELPQAPLERLMGKLLNHKYDELSTEHWKQLLNIPKEKWDSLWDQIFDIYCDLFEELDINETFPLVKRYVIPQWVKEDILDIP